MAHSDDEQKKRLRKYLNPAIKGPNTEIILESLAPGATHLIHSVESVNDQLYITTASERFLDQRMADRDITRPDNVGLSDEVFRDIGIEVSTRKQVRDLIHEILETMYGAEFTRSFVNSSEFEPYQLADGDNLILEFDDGEELEIIFNVNQFSNISAATAQEVADAITRGIRKLNRTGIATPRDDGAGGFVQLFSETKGPSSTVRVRGGSAQNQLKFPEIRPTTGEVTTEWTLSVQPSGSVRATWTGGPNPNIGKIKKDDYVNIFGTAFLPANRGTFTVTLVQGGLVGDSYVEYSNPEGANQVTLQGTLDAILFFNPKRISINSKANFAAGYQTSNRLLEVFMPATTRVVRRERVGAAHLHESGASTEDDLGPYVFDTSKPFIVGEEETTNTFEIDSNTERIIETLDASSIPDEEGHLVFGFGTSKEEGPVPYIARPSSGTILIDPSYRFKNVHPVGTNISLISQNYAYDVERDGSDVPFYGTDIVSGRIYAEDLIKLVGATGIVLNLIILYPGDEGLGKWSDDFFDKDSERYYVWGKDPGATLFERDE